MLAKLRTALFLIRRFGPGWLAFRLWYALQLRLGLLRWKMPAYAWANRPLAYWLKPEVPSEPNAYADWRRQHCPPFFFEKLPPAFSADAVPEAEPILSGELKYFEHTWHRIGFPPDWLLDPVSGKRLAADRHWTQISDDGTDDIKIIWEASRFGMTYTLARAYASNRDERFAEAFWDLVHSWTDSNPPNQGPNWMDGQECALRIMALTFGLYAFWDSPATTPERLAGLTVIVAALAERIDRNTAFAISTRGNHSISEGMGLWLAGLLFPELKTSAAYLAKGWKILEQEAAYQLFPDGTYSMYSLNYHRFVLQIYFYAIRLGEINHSPFSDQLKQSISASLDFMYQLIDLPTGRMPVFGSNDGALVLPLNSCDFNDYRPLLQLGYYLLHGKRLFDHGPWDEDMCWLCGAYALDASLEEVPQQNSVFPIGGVYTLCDADSLAVIRCVDYRERPSHADQLHLDLWIHGKNITCDAGTYLYTGEGLWRNGLARTAVHNTVTVDGKDQMDMVSRFTWVNWSKGKMLRNGEINDIRGWQGEQDGYTRLPNPVSHRRTVLMLGKDRWLVVDQLSGSQFHHYRLHWLLPDASYVLENNAIRLWPEAENVRVGMGNIESEAGLSVVRGDAESRRGWRSRYYGHKEPALSVVMESDQSSICFWTYFGVGDDVVELDGKLLKINAPGLSVAVDLGELD